MKLPSKRLKKKRLCLSLQWIMDWRWARVEAEEVWQWSSKRWWQLDSGGTLEQERFGRLKMCFGDGMPELAEGLDLMENAMNYQGWHWLTSGTIYWELEDGRELGVALEHRGFLKAKETKSHFSYFESEILSWETRTKLSLLVFTLRQQKFHSLMAVSQNWPFGIWIFKILFA